MQAQVITLERRTWWNVMETKQADSVKYFLSHEQQVEILAWYRVNGRYIWNYDGKALRLWADSDGFGVQFTFNGKDWNDDGDFNDDTICYFSSYEQWTEYREAFERVDVEWIDAQIQRYSDEFDHENMGFSQPWVLHPNGAGGFGVIFNAPCGTNYARVGDWKALAVYINDALADRENAKIYAKEAAYVHQYRKNWLEG